MTSRREARSVSLGRHRERPPRDLSRGAGDEESTTRHNVSNFMLTLQRVQTAEDENRQLRKENQLLRQRARSSRLSSASFSSGCGPGSSHRSASPTGGITASSSVGTRPDLDRTTTAMTTRSSSETEDKMIEAHVKRNSLIFVGDSPVELSQEHAEHAALQAQHKKLQTDFDTVKDFLKHLFQHALTMSSSSSSSTPCPSKDHGGHPHASSSSSSSSYSSFTAQDSRHPSSSLYKDTTPYHKHSDVNTYNPLFSKQLEHNLEDIHGEISQLRSSQDQQQLRMEQVQLALDNVLNQSSVRNDVTMRIVRQQDKMKDLQRHVSYLDSNLMDVTKSLRQAEERLGRLDKIQHNLDHFISSNSKNLKGTTRSDLKRFSDQMSQLKCPSHQPSKMAVSNKMVAHISSASSQGHDPLDSKPPLDVINSMSKLERLIGSDWHRFGRMLGLDVDCLDDIGKFTNFDLTTRVEKVMATWSRTQRGANGDLLKQALTKMDRDILLLADVPVSKDVCPVTPDVLAFFVAHVVDVSSLCHSLAWQGVLPQDSISFILGVSEEYRRASRLIHTTVFMGLAALQALCHVLDTSNQTHVAFKLKGCLPIQEENNTWEVLQSVTTLNKHPTTATSTLFASSSTLQTSKRQYYSNNSNNNNNNNISSSNNSNNNNNNNNNPNDFKAADSNPLDSSSSSSSSHNRPEGRAGEKQPRQKRSRSLFTRKNKLRDNETSSTDHRQEQQVRDRPETGNPRDSYYPVTVV